VSIRHTLTKGVALSTLLLLIAAPAGAASSDTTTTRGTAATTSVPLSVEALGLDPVKLGQTVLMATTDSDRTTLAPWSTVQLTLAEIAGETFGQVAVSSDGVTTSEGAVVDETTTIGTVGATAGDVLAVANDSANTATAVLTTLTADATVLNLLGLEATITDVVTTVNDGGAAATHSLVVAGIDLDLAHVLGSVLAELPLEDLLALADELGVDVPVNLDPVHDVVTATEELVTAVTAAVDAANAVDTAVQALLDADALDPLADYGDIAGYEALLTSLEGLSPSTDLVGTLASITDIINNNTLYGDLACGVSIPALDLNAVQTALGQMIACVETHLQAYADAVAALGDELTELEAAVTTYIDAVATAATAAATGGSAAGDLTVSDILSDIEDLVTGLLAADLFTIGPIDVSQRVRAVGGQLDESSASHTCKVTTIAALGADGVPIADCDGANDTLATVVDTITGTLQTVLDTVGGVDAGDGVSLELFGTVEDTVTDGGDGWVRATSVMEVLALTVPDITITPCDVADGLVCGLGLDIEGTLTTVLDALDEALTTAQATAEGAIDTGAVSDLLTALGAEDLITDVTDVDAATVQTAVDSAVTALTGALDSLIDGLGDLGTAGGVAVPGAKIVVDPSLEAEHQVTTASVDDPTPANPAPDPGDDPTLPNTGGGAALLAVLAIGAGAWLWRRREAH